MIDLISFRKMVLIGASFTAKAGNMPPTAMPAARPKKIQNVRDSLFIV